MRREFVNVYVIVRGRVGTELLGVFRGLFVIVGFRKKSRFEIKGGD